MKLVPLVCLCLLSRSGGSSADGNGPAVLKVEEGSDVILPCSLSTNQDIGSGLFYWKKVAQGDQPYKEVFMYEGGRHSNNGLDGQSEQFKGRVIHFPADLKHGNASILITNTKVVDSGNYTCDFPRLQPRQIFTVELVVGAALKPSVTILDETKDWSLLQCEVHGSPQPKVEWKDSSGNLLPAEQPQVSQRGGRYDIILQTTVTKTGRYRCVATQETINHQIHAEIYVYIGESPTGAVVVAVLVAVLCTLLVVAVLLAVLVAKGYIPLKCAKGSPPETRVPLKDPGLSDQGPEVP